MTGPNHKADAAIVSLICLLPPEITQLVGYCYFEWLPEACRHHRHNAGMIGKGPFSRHSTSLW